MWDYYHKYRFKLPFELTSSNYAGRLYFNTMYSTDEMCAKLTAAGYNVELFTIDDTASILITVNANDTSYYFIIFEQNKSNSKVGYVLCNAELLLGCPGEGLYSVLAPIHVMDSIMADDRTVRVYCDFEYISNFYKRIRKNDIIIDEVNKTITLKSKGSANSGLLYGEVIISFREIQENQYLDFEVCGISTADAKVIK